MLHRHTHAHVQPVVKTPRELTSGIDCSKCKRGTFDLCDECFELGEHCLDNNHVLEKFYAWKYIRHVDKAEKASWKCSNAQCAGQERNDDFFFSKFAASLSLSRPEARQYNTSKPRV